MSKDKGRKEVKKPKKPKIKPEGFTLVEIALVLVGVGIIGGASWFVYHSKQNTDNAYNKAASLSTAAKNSAKPSASDSQGSTSSNISASLKENAAASIDSQNTAALEGYMTSPVNVVIAASEKGGDVSVIQAIKDLEYLNTGTSPWDFNLPAATLTTYKAGFYGKYFGANTIVGKSANDYVVSFGVNSAGKIDTVFMTNNASSLTD